MNYKLKEQKLVNLQLLAILGFIISLIISYILTYNKKLSIENKKGIFDNKTAQNLSLFQTILVFIITITFLYITYNEYIISKKKKENNTNDLLLQIITAILSLISASIGLYIISKNYIKKKGTNVPNFPPHLT